MVLKSLDDVQRSQATTDFRLAVPDSGECHLTGGELAVGGEAHIHAGGDTVAACACTTTRTWVALLSSADPEGTDDLARPLVCLPWLRSDGSTGTSPMIRRRWCATAASIRQSLQQFLSASPAERVVRRAARQTVKWCRYGRLWLRRNREAKTALGRETNETTTADSHRASQNEMETRLRPDAACELKQCEVEVHLYLVAVDD